MILDHLRIGFLIPPRASVSRMAASTGAAANLCRCRYQTLLGALRWGWAPLWRAWRLSGDSRYRDGLNAWSRSWCQANPVNGGSNWLCGQEASMRLLHALQAWQLSDAPGLLLNPTPERAAFAAAHLQRIGATERYAQAQDNNHWTSEAAALFIGGSWLAATASPHAPAARHWAKSGRRALERSVGRLVLPDGSFAQHSLTYHRLLLDTSPRWSSGAAGWIWSHFPSASPVAAVPPPPG